MIVIFATVGDKTYTISVNPISTVNYLRRILIFLISVNFNTRDIIDTNEISLPINSNINFDRYDVYKFDGTFCNRNQTILKFFSDFNSCEFRDSAGIIQIIYEKIQLIFNVKKIKEKVE